MPGGVFLDQFQGQYYRSRYVYQLSPNSFVDAMGKVFEDIYLAARTRIEVTPAQWESRISKWENKWGLNDGGLSDEECHRLLNRPYWFYKDDEGNIVYRFRVHISGSNTMPIPPAGPGSAVEFLPSVHRNVIDGSFEVNPGGFHGTRVFSYFELEPPERTEDISLSTNQSSANANSTIPSSGIPTSYGKHCWMQSDQVSEHHYSAVNPQYQSTGSSSWTKPSFNTTCKSTSPYASESSGRHDTLLMSTYPGDDGYINDMRATGYQPQQMNLNGSHNLGHISHDGPSAAFQDMDHNVIDLNSRFYTG